MEYVKKKRNERKNVNKIYLTDTVDDLPDLRVVEASAGQHPVGHHRDEHGEQPHAQVWKGRHEPVLLDKQHLL